MTIPSNNTFFQCSTSFCAKELADFLGRVMPCSPVPLKPAGFASNLRLSTVEPRGKRSFNYGYMKSTMDCGFPHNQACHLTISRNDFDGEAAQDVAVFSLVLQAVVRRKG